MLPDPPTLDYLVAHTTPLRGGCLAWAGARDGKGYGNVARMRQGVGKNWIVHRLVYELSIGPIPDKHDVHHRCENKLCINPEHLEAVTRREHQGLDGRHPAHMAPAWRGRDAANDRRRVSARRGEQ